MPFPALCSERLRLDKNANVNYLSKCRLRWKHAAGGGGAGEMIIAYLGVDLSRHQLPTQMGLSAAQPTENLNAWHLAIPSVWLSPWLQMQSPER